MRLFVALPIPDMVAGSLLLLEGGVPGARWQAREQMHLTLRFIGEVDGSDARALDDALAGIDAPGFELQLHGVGQFGNKQPHALWASARKNELLEHLQRKVDTAIRRVGQPPSSGDKHAHKFMPHITLARLRHPEMDKVRQWLTEHALYTSAEFRVDAFCLYSSKLTSDGSIYRVEQEYPLRGFDTGGFDDQADD
jgi:2'-5' RNA ligase